MRLGRTDPSLRSSLRAVTTGNLKEAGLLGELKKTLLTIHTDLGDLSADYRFGSLNLISPVNYI